MRLGARLAFLLLVLALAGTHALIPETAHAEDPPNKADGAKNDGDKKKEADKKSDDKKPDDEKGADKGEETGKADDADAEKGDNPTTKHRTAKGDVDADTDADAKTPAEKRFLTSRETTTGVNALETLLKKLRKKDGPKGEEREKALEEVRRQARLLKRRYDAFLEKLPLDEQDRVVRAGNARLDALFDEVRALERPGSGGDAPSPPPTTKGSLIDAKGGVWVPDALPSSSLRKSALPGDDGVTGEGLTRKTVGDFVGGNEGAKVGFDDGPDSAKGGGMDGAYHAKGLDLAGLPGAPKPPPLAKRALGNLETEPDPELKTQPHETSSELYVSTRGDAKDSLKDKSAKEIKALYGEYNRDAFQSGLHDLTTDELKELEKKIDKDLPSDDFHRKKIIGDIRAKILEREEPEKAAEAAGTKYLRSRQDAASALSIDPEEAKRVGAAILKINNPATRAEGIAQLIAAEKLADKDGKVDKYARAALEDRLKGYDSAYLPSRIKEDIERGIALAKDGVRKAAATEAKEEEDKARRKAEEESNGAAKAFLGDDATDEKVKGLRAAIAAITSGADGDKSRKGWEALLGITGDKYRNADGTINTGALKADLAKNPGLGLSLDGASHHATALAALNKPLQDEVLRKAPDELAKKLEGKDLAAIAAMKRDLEKKRDALDEDSFEYRLATTQLAALGRHMSALNDAETIERKAVAGKTLKEAKARLTELEGAEGGTDYEKQQRASQLKAVRSHIKFLEDATKELEDKMGVGDLKERREDITALLAGEKDADRLKGLLREWDARTAGAKSLVEKQQRGRVAASLSQEIRYRETLAEIDTWRKGAPNGEGDDERRHRIEEGLRGMSDYQLGRLRETLVSRLSDVRAAKKPYDNMIDELRALEKNRAEDNAPKIAAAKAKIEKARPTWEPLVREEGRLQGLLGSKGDLSTEQDKRLLAKNYEAVKAERQQVLDEKFKDRPLYTHAQREDVRKEADELLRTSQAALDKLRETGVHGGADVAQMAALMGRIQAANEVLGRIADAANNPVPDPAKLPRYGGPLGPAATAAVKEQVTADMRKERGESLTKSLADLEKRKEELAGKIRDAKGEATPDAAEIASLEGQLQVVSDLIDDRAQRAREFLDGRVDVYGQKEADRPKTKAPFVADRVKFWMDEYRKSVEKGGGTWKDSMEVTYRERAERAAEQDWIMESNRRDLARKRAWKDLEGGVERDARLTSMTASELERFAADLRHVAGNDDKYKKTGNQPTVDKTLSAVDSQLKLAKLRDAWREKKPEEVTAELDARAASLDELRNKMKGLRSGTPYYESQVEKYRKQFAEFEALSDVAREQALTGKKDASGNVIGKPDPDAMDRIAAKLEENGLNAQAAAWRTLAGQTRGLDATQADTKAASDAVTRLNDVYVREEKAAADRKQAIDRLQKEADALKEKALRANEQQDAALKAYKASLGRLDELRKKLSATRDRETWNGLKSQFDDEVKVLKSAVKQLDESRQTAQDAAAAHSEALVRLDGQYEIARQAERDIARRTESDRDKALDAADPKGAAELRMADYVKALRDATHFRNQAGAVAAQAKELRDQLATLKAKAAAAGTEVPADLVKYMEGEIARLDGTGGAPGGLRGEMLKRASEIEADLPALRQKMEAAQKKYFTSETSDYKVAALWDAELKRYDDAETALKGAAARSAAGIDLPVGKQDLEKLTAGGAPIEKVPFPAFREEKVAAANYGVQQAARAVTTTKLDLQGGYPPAGFDQPGAFLREALGTLDPRVRNALMKDGDGALFYRTGENTGYALLVDKDPRSATWGQIRMVEQRATDTAWHTDKALQGDELRMPTFGAEETLAQRREKAEAWMGQFSPAQLAVILKQRSDALLDEIRAVEKDTGIGPRGMMQYTNFDPLRFFSKETIEKFAKETGRDGLTVAGERYRAHFTGQAIRSLLALTESGRMIGNDGKGTTPALQAGLASLSDWLSPATRTALSQGLADRYNVAAKEQKSILDKVTSAPLEAWNFLRTAFGEGDGTTINETDKAKATAALAVSGLLDAAKSDSGVASWMGRFLEADQQTSHYARAVDNLAGVQEESFQYTKMAVFLAIGATVAVASGGAGVGAWTVIGKMLTYGTGAVLAASLAMNYAQGYRGDDLAYHTGADVLAHVASTLAGGAAGSALGGLGKVLKVPGFLEGSGKLAAGAAHVTVGTVAGATAGVAAAWAHKRYDALMGKGDDALTFEEGWHAGKWGGVLGGGAGLLHAVGNFFKRSPAKGGVKAATEGTETVRTVVEDPPTPPAGDTLGKPAVESPPGVAETGRTNPTTVDGARPVASGETRTAGGGKPQAIPETGAPSVPSGETGGTTGAQPSLAGGQTAASQPVAQGGLAAPARISSPGSSTSGAAAASSHQSGAPLSENASQVRFGNQELGNRTESSVRARLGFSDLDTGSSRPVAAGEKPLASGKLTDASGQKPTGTKGTAAETPGQPIAPKKSVAAADIPAGEPVRVKVVDTPAKPAQPARPGLASQPVSGETTVAGGQAKPASRPAAVAADTAAGESFGGTDVSDARTTIFRSPAKDSGVKGLAKQGKSSQLGPLPEEGRSGSVTAFDSVEQSAIDRTRAAGRRSGLTPKETESAVGRVREQAAKFRAQGESVAEETLVRTGQEAVDSVTGAKRIAELSEGSPGKARQLRASLENDLKGEKIDRVSPEGQRAVDKALDRVSERTETDTIERAGKAAAAAEKNLADLTRPESGATPEEIRAARTSVEKAQARLDAARIRQAGNEAARGAAKSGQDPQLAREAVESRVQAKILAEKAAVAEQQKGFASEEAREARRVAESARERSAKAEIERTLDNEARKAEDGGPSRPAAQVESDVRTRLELEQAREGVERASSAVEQARKSGRKADVAAAEKNLKAAQDRLDTASAHRNGFVAEAEARAMGVSPEKARAIGEALRQQELAEIAYRNARADLQRTPWWRSSEARARVRATRAEAEQKGREAQKVTQEAKLTPEQRERLARRLAEQPVHEQLRGFFEEDVKTSRARLTEAETELTRLQDAEKTIRPDDTRGRTELARRIADTRKRVETLRGEHESAVRALTALQEGGEAQPLRQLMSRLRQDAASGRLAHERNIAQLEAELAELERTGAASEKTTRVGEKLARERGYLAEAKEAEQALLQAPDSPDMGWFLRRRAVADAELAGSQAADQALEQNVPRALAEEIGRAVRDRRLSEWALRQAQREIESASSPAGAREAETILRDARSSLNRTNARLEDLLGSPSAGTKATEGIRRLAQLPDPTDTTLSSLTKAQRSLLSEGGERPSPTTPESEPAPILARRAMEIETARQAELAAARAETKQLQTTLEKAQQAGDRKTAAETKKALDAASDKVARLEAQREGDLAALDAEARARREGLPNPEKLGKAAGDAVARQILEEANYRKLQAEAADAPWWRVDKRLAARSARARAESAGQKAQELSDRALLTPSEREALAKFRAERPIVDQLRLEATKQRQALETGLEEAQRELTRLTSRDQRLAKAKGDVKHYEEALEKAKAREQELSAAEKPDPKDLREAGRMRRLYESSLAEARRNIADIANEAITREKIAEASAKVDELRPKVDAAKQRELALRESDELPPARLLESLREEASTAERGAEARLDAARAKLAEIEKAQGKASEAYRDTEKKVGLAEKDLEAARAAKLALDKVSDPVRFALEAQQRAREAVAKGRPESAPSVDVEGTKLRELTANERTVLDSLRGPREGVASDPDVITKRLAEAEGRAQKKAAQIERDARELGLTNDQAKALGEAVKANELAQAGKDVAEAKLADASLFGKARAARDARAARTNAQDTAAALDDLIADLSPGQRGKVLAELDAMGSRRPVALDDQLAPAQGAEAAKYAADRARLAELEKSARSLGDKALEIEQKAGRGQASPEEARLARSAADDAWKKVTQARIDAEVARAEALSRQLGLTKSQAAQAREVARLRAETESLAEKWEGALERAKARGASAEELARLERNALQAREAAELMGRVQQSIEAPLAASTRLTQGQLRALREHLGRQGLDTSPATLPTDLGELSMLHGERLAVEGFNRANPLPAKFRIETPSGTVRFGGGESGGRGGPRPPGSRPGGGREIPKPASPGDGAAGDGTMRFSRGPESLEPPASRAPAGQQSLAAEGEASAPSSRPIGTEATRTIPELSSEQLSGLRSIASELRGLGSDTPAQFPAARPKPASLASAGGGTSLLRAGAAAARYWTPSLAGAPIAQAAAPASPALLFGLRGGAEQQRMQVQEAAQRLLEERRERQLQKQVEGMTEEQLRGWIDTTAHEMADAAKRELARRQQEQIEKRVAGMSEKELGSWIHSTADAMAAAAKKELARRQQEQIEKRVAGMSEKELGSWIHSTANAMADAAKEELQRRQQQQIEKRVAGMSEKELGSWTHSTANAMADVAKEELQRRQQQQIEKRVAGMSEKELGSWVHSTANAMADAAKRELERRTEVALRNHLDSMSDEKLAELAADPTTHEELASQLEATDRILAAVARNVARGFGTAAASTSPRTFAVRGNAGAAGRGRNDSRFAIARNRTDDNGLIGGGYPAKSITTRDDNGLIGGGFPAKSITTMDDNGLIGGGFPAKSITTMDDNGLIGGGFPAKSITTRDDNGLVGGGFPRVSGLELPSVMIFGPNSAPASPGERMVSAEPAREAAASDTGIPAGPPAIPRRLSTLLESPTGLDPVEKRSLVRQLLAKAEALRLGGKSLGTLSSKDLAVTATGELLVLAEPGEASPEGNASADVEKIRLAIEQAPFVPPLDDARIDGILRNLALDGSSFPRGEAFPWRKFYLAVSEKLAGIGNNLSPASGAAIIALDRAMGDRFANSPRRIGFHGPAGKTASYPLAAHALTPEGRRRLAALRDELDARFRAVKALAAGGAIDWAQAHDILSAPSKAFSDLRITLDDGAVAYAGRHAKSVTAETLWDAFLQGVRLGDWVKKIAWSPDENVVTVRLQLTVIHGDESVDLFDDRLLGVPGLAAPLRLLRESVRQQEALVATEELGHLRQTLGLLLDDEPFLQLPFLERLLAAAPELPVYRTPIIAMRSQDFPPDIREKVQDGKAIAYTREADVYLHAVDIFGVSRVPLAIADRFGYREREGIRRLLELPRPATPASPPGRRPAPDVAPSSFADEASVAEFLNSIDAMWSVDALPIPLRKLRDHRATRETTARMRALARELTDAVEAARNRALADLQAGASGKARPSEKALERKIATRTEADAAVRRIRQELAALATPLVEQINRRLAKQAPWFVDPSAGTIDGLTESVRQAVATLKLRLAKTREGARVAEIRRAAAERRKDEARLEADLRQAGVDRARYDNRRKLPLPFQSEAQMRELVSELRALLVEAGIDDAAIRLKGTGVDFYSNSPRKARPRDGYLPFFDRDPAERSDLDVVIDSRKLASRIRSARKPSGEPVVPNEVNPMFLAEEPVVQAALPALEDFASTWKSRLGDRKVQIGIRAVPGFEQAEGASILVATPNRSLVPSSSPAPRRTTGGRDSGEARMAAVSGLSPEGTTPEELYASARWARRAENEARQRRAAIESIPFTNDRRELSEAIVRLVPSLGQPGLAPVLAKWVDRTLARWNAKGGAHRKANASSLQALLATANGQLLDTAELARARRTRDLITNHPFLKQLRAALLGNSPDGSDGILRHYTDNAMKGRAGDARDTRAVPDPLRRYLPPQLAQALPPDGLAALRRGLNVAARKWERKEPVDFSELLSPLRAWIQDRLARGPLAPSEKASSDESSSSSPSELALLPVFERNVVIGWRTPAGIFVENDAEIPGTEGAMVAFARRLVDASRLRKLDASVRTAKSTTERESAQRLLYAELDRVGEIAALLDVYDDSAFRELETPIFYVDDENVTQVLRTYGEASEWRRAERDKIRELEKAAARRQQDIPPKGAANRDLLTGIYRKALKEAQEGAARINARLADSKVDEILEPRERVAVRLNEALRLLLHEDSGYNVNRVEHIRRHLREEPDRANQSWFEQVNATTGKWEEPKGSELVRLIDTLTEAAKWTGFALANEKEPKNGVASPPDSFDVMVPLPAGWRGMQRNGDQVTPANYATLVFLTPRRPDGAPRAALPPDFFDAFRRDPSQFALFNMLPRTEAAYDEASRQAAALAANRSGTGAAAPREIASTPNPPLSLSASSADPEFQQFLAAKRAASAAYQRARQRLPSETAERAADEAEMSARATEAYEIAKRILTRNGTAFVEIAPGKLAITPKIDGTPLEQFAAKLESYEMIDPTLTPAQIAANRAANRRQPIATLPHKLVIDVLAAVQIGGDAYYHPGLQEYGLSEDGLRLNRPTWVDTLHERMHFFLTQKLGGRSLAGGGARGTLNGLMWEGPYGRSGGLLFQELVTTTIRLASLGSHLIDLAADWEKSERPKSVVAAEADVLFRELEGELATNSELPLRIVAIAAKAREALAGSPRLAIFRPGPSDPESSIKVWLNVENPNFRWDATTDPMLKVGLQLDAPEEIRRAAESGADVVEAYARLGIDAKLAGIIALGEDLARAYRRLRESLEARRSVPQDYLAFSVDAAEEMAAALRAVGSPTREVWKTMARADAEFASFVRTLASSDAARLPDVMTQLVPFAESIDEGAAAETRVAAGTLTSDARDVAELGRRLKALAEGWDADPAARPLLAPGIAAVLERLQLLRDRAEARARALSDAADATLAARQARSRERQGALTVVDWDTKQGTLTVRVPVETLPGGTLSGGIASLELTIEIPRWAGDAIAGVGRPAAAARRRARAVAGTLVRHRLLTLAEDAARLARQYGEMPIPETVGAVKLFRLLGLAKPGLSRLLSESASRAEAARRALETSATVQDKVARAIAQEEESRIAQGEGESLSSAVLDPVRDLWDRLVEAIGRRPGATGETAAATPLSPTPVRPFTDVDMPRALPIFERFRKELAALGRPEVLPEALAASEALRRAMQVIHSLPGTAPDGSHDKRNDLVPKRQLFARALWRLFRIERRLAERMGTQLIKAFILGDSPEVPAPLELPDPVHLDQAYNITSGKEPNIVPVPENERGPFDVYQYDIPVEVVGEDYIARSANLEERIRRLVLIEKDGVRYVRFYIADDQPKIAFREFDERYGQYRLPEKLVGSKLLSRATYRITRRGDPTFPTLDIKMGLAAGYNPGVFLRGAVAANDLIAQALRGRAQDTEPFALMPEVFAAQLDNGARDFAYVIRQHEAGAPDPDYVRLLPVHGLFGNEAVRTLLAERRGQLLGRPMTGDEWLVEEFMPKLGRFHAELNFRHGLYLQGHTQNTLVRVDARTAEVLGFVGRDLSDMLYAPAHRLLHGLDFLFDDQTERLYQMFQGKQVYSMPEVHAIQYVAQVTDAAFGIIRNGTGTNERQVAARAAFLREYLSRAEAITGVSGIREGDLPGAIERGFLDLAMKLIHERISAAWAERVLHPEIAPAERQPELAQAFRAALAANHVAFLAAAPTGQEADYVEYGTDGRHVYAMTTLGQRPKVFGMALLPPPARVPATTPPPLASAPEGPKAGAGTAPAPIEQSGEGRPIYPFRWFWRNAPTPGDVTAQVEQDAEGNDVLRLPSGKAFPLLEQRGPGLFQRPYVVAAIPYSEFRFNQAWFDVVKPHVIEMLRDTRFMERLRQDGIVETEIGALHEDGTVLITDGHHRRLALAIYVAFLEHGNKPELAPGAKGFTEALVTWARDAIFAPLSWNGIDRGTARLTEQERAQRFVAIYRRVLAILGEARIPYRLYAHDDGSYKVRRGGAGSARPLEYILAPFLDTWMREQSLGDASTLAAVGRPHVPVRFHEDSRVPFLSPTISHPARYDEWLAEYERRFPELAARDAQLTAYTRPALRPHRP